jgi:hypothetical protein
VWGLTNKAPGRCQQIYLKSLIMTRQKVASIIFFIMPLLFAWVLVGQIIQSGLTVDKLIKVTGIVENTKEVTSHVKKGLLYTHKDVELRIYLKDTTEYFRIMDVYRYQRFRGQLLNGDTAEIYIRPKWLVAYGLGYRNDIFHLTINGKTIFDISETHKNENGIVIVSIIAIPLFILLGLWTKRKARDKKQQATVNL